MLYKTLLSFNQRRLAKHQAESSYLLQPLNDRSKPLPSFEETGSSEEDFGFINDKIMILDNVTKKLLKGVVQVEIPPRKHQADLESKEKSELEEDPSATIAASLDFLVPFEPDRKKNRINPSLNVDRNLDSGSEYEN